ncbi:MAG: hypothetical protein QNJ60_10375 [Xenococcaceae cyanobacterium MO_188.B19]|nr:hypothetical protein [Xenococcaceae cyanobacterium MO_188.B19]
MEVYKTGMCPAAPTDIPPDPCTVQEFLFRMAFSPFALIAITFLYFVWLIVCVLFYQIYLWIRK